MAAADIARRVAGGLRRWIRPRRTPVWHHPHYRLPITSLESRIGIEPRRADLVLWFLRGHGLLPAHLQRRPHRALYAQLALVHTAAYLESLTRVEPLAHIFGVDSWDVDPDQIMHTMRLACGATIDATRYALRRGSSALNLLGGFHHASPAKGGGLCAVNDVAIALAVVRHEGFAGRVAILDLDAHPPDGLSDCLGDDDAVWIGSLSGSDWGPLRADETVLPQRAGDAPYLAALDDLLERMPPADLAFVIAGGDVLGTDPLGLLGLTLDGARARDRKVLAAVADTASVWLPGGGYTTDAWKVLAGTALVLLDRPHWRIAPDTDPMALHFAAMSANLDGDLREPPLFTEDDVADMFGPRRTTRTLLLGYYSAEGLELALEAFGVLSHLRRLGYRTFRVDIDRPSTGERFRLFGTHAGHELMLVECVLERREVAGRPVLYIHWLTLRHPAGTFSDRKPQLPGQEVPGLGMSREAGELLQRVAVRLGLDGLAWTPAWYHTARISIMGGRFEFVDPAREGRFEALQRDLGAVPLRALTVAMAEGRVRLNGAAYAWEPSEMVSWIASPPGDAEARAAAVAAERERCRFELVEDG